MDGSSNQGRWSEFRIRTKNRYETLLRGFSLSSPCCAAASLAGATNALLGIKRHDPGAIVHEDVLILYREVSTSPSTKQAP